MLGRARVYVLVDADPHGIDIMSNYVNGARGTKFSKDHTGLALGGRAEWVGVKASDWFGWVQVIGLFSSVIMRTTVRRAEV